jgi:HAD superfamily hydrolase (TIGR01509 family)
MPRTPSSPIRAVGFDYTGVLASLPPGDIFEQVAGITGSERNTVQTAYHRYNRDFQLGRLDQAGLWRRVVADLQADDRFNAVFEAARARLPIVNQPVVAFVDQLHRAGYKVGLLTNLATPTPWSEDLYAQGLHKHFDAVGLSGETGLVKPEPAAFQWLATHLGVRLAELVFTDDRPAAMAGADKLGLRTIRFQNLPQLQAELRTLSIEWDGDRTS